MTGYAIVDIPGWESFSLNAADRAHVDERLGELAYGTVPDDIPRDTATPFRMEVYKQLARVVDQARTAGAGLICLPVERTGDVSVPASYTVSEWRDTEPQAVEPDAFLEALAAHSTSDARIVDVDGQPALREEDVEPARPTEDPLALRAARKVTYTIASPIDPRSWVVFTFVTIGSGDPSGALADVLVDLFDAHLTTLRWSDL